MNWWRLKQENEILSSEIVEKMKSVEREKSEFIESHLAERRNEIDKLKEHHRFLQRTFHSFCRFLLALFCLDSNEMIYQHILRVWLPNEWVIQRWINVFRLLVFSVIWKLLSMLQSSSGKIKQIFLAPDKFCGSGNLCKYRYFHWLKLGSCHLHRHLIILISLWVSFPGYGQFLESPTVLWYCSLVDRNGIGLSKTCATYP